MYGLGACVMIIILQFFKKNDFTLFFGGILVGSLTEYLVSLIGEWLFNTKWWDYSGFPLNINGRVCLLYSIFWGILAFFLLKYINPLIDKFFIFIKQKFNLNLLKTLLLGIVIFMALDYIISSFAIRAFLSRTIINNNLQVSNQTKIQNEYRIIYSTNYISNFVYKYFGDEKMLKTFPRIKIEKNNGEIIQVKDLYPNIKTYYIKLIN
ncbi:MAG: putative ABC transporter permease [Clostridia bacterium]|nr:putative ABC transporter permease [Clostridia bacterium]